MKRKMLAAALALGFAGTALAGSMVASDLLSVDQTAGTSQQGALSLVDPGSGARTLFSNFGNAGQGQLVASPVFLSVAQ